MSDWITDRLPTKADADSDEEVLIPMDQHDTPPDGTWQHYSLVVPGQPWAPHA